MDLDFNKVERNKYINSKIKNTTYFIAYFCFGNCSSDSSDDELVYMMDINYTGYKIDHQNENVPLETHNLNYTSTKPLFFPSIILTYFELSLKL